MSDLRGPVSYYGGSVGGPRKKRRVKFNPLDNGENGLVAVLRGPQDDLGKGKNLVVCDQIRIRIDAPIHRRLLLLTFISHLLPHMVQNIEIVALVRNHARCWKEAFIPGSGHFLPFSCQHLGQRIRCFSVHP